MKTINKKKLPTKALFFCLIAGVIFLASFNKGSANEKADVFASSVQTSPGENLINKNDCSGCHNKSEKMLGPSYLDIAKKYPVNVKSITLLSDRIINGSTNIWGNVPMPAHANIGKADARLIVKYILSLRNKK